MKEEDEPPSGPPPGVPVRYVEAPRSYRSAWLFLALLLAGFLFDLTLGGGIAHWPGWALAIVLVVGVNLLVIYAARVSKSLRVTDEEVWVGEEVIRRDEIAGRAEPTGELGELPVLGWPSGMPRGLKRYVVRMVDELEVIIPTRFPDRLEAVLHPGVSVAAADSVRPARSADLAELPEIDRRADAVFRVAGYDLPAVPWGDDRLDAAKAVFVYGDPAVGFVLVTELDGLAHVDEIAVIPKRMRQGIGTQLLERACAWARETGYPAITLTTYADVPWNAPYYAARGFVTVDGDALTPGLRGQRVREANLGLDAVGPRIAMRREL